MTQPIQLDINELLDDFARENGGVTQRAILAEGNVKARDKIIDKLAERVAELESALEAREALDSAAADDERGELATDTKDDEPRPEKKVRGRPVKDAPQA